MVSKSRSLRVKLTLWFLIVFSAIQLTLLIGVAFWQRKSIREAVDANMASSARDMVDSLISSEGDFGADELQEYLPARASFDGAVVRDERGTVLARWNVPEDAAPPLTAWEIVPTGPLGPVFTTLDAVQARPLTGADDPVRVLTVPYRKASKLHYLQVVLRHERLAALLGPLLDLLLLGVPAGTIAALIAAWIIAGRAVSPIRKLSDAARDVSPERLSGRIEVKTSDDEISKLQHELNAALERLEAGYRAQEQFISNVSHELKTPIAVLVTEAQVLRADARPEERDAFLRRVEDEMRGLGRLVETFLQIAGADIGARVSFVPVALHDLLVDAVEGAESLAARRRVALVPHIDGQPGRVPEARVMGDPVLLRTMLDNLVRNAIRHSPRGAPVRVELACDEHNARYTVRDLGPGIPEEAQEQVFERFVRLKREGDEEPGSGLGLSIAAQIAALHDGTITVSNGEEGGSLFVIELPLSNGRNGA